MLKAIRGEKGKQRIKSGHLGGREVPRRSRGLERPSLVREVCGSNLGSAETFFQDQDQEKIANFQAKWLVFLHPQKSRRPSGLAALSS